MAVGKTELSSTIRTGAGSVLVRRGCQAAAAVILAVALLATVPVAAADPPAPDTFEVASAFAARNVHKDGDFVLVFHYNVGYTETPAVTVDKLFHFRLLDTDGSTVLAAAKPYAYQARGYGEGVGAFYFSSWSGWDEPYIVQIRGNPEYWATPPVVSYPVSANEYSETTTQSDSQAALGDYIIRIAQHLEIAWNVVMVNETELGPKLSTTGETYFRGTIQGLAYIVPGILSVSTSDPDWSGFDYTTDQADAYASRFDGTWVGDALGSIQELGFDPMLVTGFVTLIIIGLMFAISYSLWGTTDPAFNGGVILFLCSYLMGFMHWAAMAMGIMIAGFYVVYIWMFRHG